MPTIHRFSDRWQLIWTQNLGQNTFGKYWGHPCDEKKTYSSELPITK